MILTGLNGGPPVRKNSFPFHGLLFVDPEKGPVLLNYGIDECRFTKPVYPGMTVGVRFTAKEKISQEKRDEKDIAKGIVKFLVDVYDDEGETVMLATILTMVQKLDQT